MSKKELQALKKMAGIRVIQSKNNYYIVKPKATIEVNDFLEEEAEGLTRAQINKIKNIGIKRIMINQTIPFAPFIFLGIVLTVLAKGNILIAVMNLF